MKQETAREPVSGDRGIYFSRLPFSEIPHQSRLFLEYLRDPRGLRKYYPNAVEETGDLAASVPTILENYYVDRNRLCDALYEINKGVGSGAATFGNIERLRDAGTVAVLTGQQAGLFSGPLYTIYKALSAVKLAQELSANGCSAVPIFWAATEDHDLDEVSEAHLIDAAGRHFRVGYKPDDVLAGISVGAVKLDGSIEAAIEYLVPQLPTTEFTADIRTSLHEAWAVSTGFGDAFSKNVASLLARFGIIYVDPRHSELKRLAAPTYRAAAERSDEIVPALVERGKQLAADGFHTQVLVEADYFPLFWHDDEGQRLSLRRMADGVYRAKDTRVELSLEDILDQIDREPDRFSPGVMLRPVVQDYLFPTVCYFGGGAEIAYFAQNSEVYRILERPITPIMHRQSFTVVEPPQRRALGGFGLKLADLFSGREEIRLRLADAVSPETGKLFAEAENMINAQLDRLDEAVSKIDPTVAANLATRKRKINYHISALKKKALLAAVRRDEVSARRIDALFEHLMPVGGLQERSLNVFYFLNKYGPNFIDWIYDSIDLTDKDHRVIEL